MNANEPFLTPALIELLTASLLLKTTNSRVLAAHLKKSPATVRTEFQRILSILNVHCRFSALKKAEENGWLPASAGEGP
jgi:DNA-binding NarL/FixJ family response regulator